MNVTTGQGSNDQHPDHDVALGEALIKDVYESLRASPQWNETLFIVTYDEHGGFYDHVVPPNAPAPEQATGAPSYPDPGYNFTQLGVRIPTVLVSPWIERGTVLSEPPQAQRPQNDSHYDLTSIMVRLIRLRAHALDAHQFIRLAGVGCLLIHPVLRTTMRVRPSTTSTVHRTDPSHHYDSSLPHNTMTHHYDVYRPPHGSFSGCIPRRH